MSGFEPDFEVSCVESMQWNRTMQANLISVLANDEGRKDQEGGVPHLDEAVLKRVQDAVRASILAEHPDAEMKITVSHEVRDVP